MEEVLEQILYKGLKKIGDEIREEFLQEIEKRNIIGFTFYIHPCGEDIVYLNKKDADAGYLQNIIFSKNEEGDKMFNRISDHPLKYLTIDGVKYEAFFCNDYEFFKDKIYDYFEKKREKIEKVPKEKKIHIPSYEVIKTKPVQKIKKAEIADSNYAFEKGNEERHKKMFKGDIENVISLLNNFEPEDSGIIKFKKVKGFNGHHFPSIILSSLDKISKIAPLHRIIHIDDTLAIELENNMSVKSMINYLKKYYKDNF
ncbi:MAG: hypothetical protein PHN56_00040 [Candidatus Nanoarchaeia archaeon]|nr:hypothetical protein [Candidatus Nanoarchaeia archaeon]